MAHAPPLTSITLGFDRGHPKVWEGMRVRGLLYVGGFDPEKWERARRFLPLGKLVMIYASKAHGGHGVLGFGTVENPPEKIAQGAKMLESGIGKELVEMMSEVYKDEQNKSSSHTKGRLRAGFKGQAKWAEECGQMDAWSAGQRWLSPKHWRHYTQTKVPSAKRESLWAGALRVRWECTVPFDQGVEKVDWEAHGAEPAQLSCLDSLMPRHFSCAQVAALKRALKSAVGEPCGCEQGTTERSFDCVGKTGDGEHRGCESGDCSISSLGKSTDCTEDKPALIFTPSASPSTMAAAITSEQVITALKTGTKFDSNWKTLVFVCDHFSGKSLDDITKFLESIRVRNTYHQIANELRSVAFFKGQGKTVLDYKQGLFERTTRFSFFPGGKPALEAALEGAKAQPAPKSTAAAKRKDEVEEDGPDVRGRKRLREGVRDGNGELTALLEGLHLSKYSRRLLDEEVDMEALRLLSDGDLRGLGLPLGPRRKLQAALAR
mmetsp:Transcript_8303/g.18102  ORF Transcript_8303/g.18102 Transcript_8303/m.18102 type:complete len:491 (+) Transcript_8303:78-1550(+)